ncbi:MAG: sugar ABC transporter substrate-binding protein [Acidobacteriota bacterium]
MSPARRAVRSPRLSVLSAGFLLLVATLFTTCSVHSDQRGRETLELWGLGREGEVVAELIPEFERRNPGIHVVVQQIPWSAAHEKLLTAYVGESTPDIAQMGNTWIPEFHAVGALEDLTPWVARSKVVRADDHFPGIWATNIVDGKLYGVPWYVDTRVIFYRTDFLKQAGYDHPPRTWSEWMEMMQRIKTPKRWPILLPTNEWNQPVMFGLEMGSKLLKDGGRYGDFEGPAFSRAFETYIGMFRNGLAPALSNNEVANLYQQFAQGEFAMYITGPWNVGEFKRRLPDNVQDKWMTAPMPAPPGGTYPGASLAGGASLSIFKRSQHKEAAWKLIEFLSETEQQEKFANLTGDLPALRAAWETPSLKNDPYMKAFRVQLENVVPTPTVPEWEQIATAVYETVQMAVRGVSTKDALASLDRKTDRILEKRRWVLAREASGEAQAK